MKKYYVFAFVLIFMSISLFAENDRKVPMKRIENSIGLAPFSQTRIRHEEPVTSLRQETAYGNDIVNNCWYSLDTETMEATTITPVNYMSFAGDYGIQGFFAHDYLTDNLIQIDPDTGAETIIADMPCPLAGGMWTELFCDKTTGDWYAIATSTFSNSELYSVDITNASVTFVAYFISAGIISGAVDRNGMLYTLDVTTFSTYETDLSTYVTTLLGVAGFDASYAQGAAYEPIDDIFYFAACSYDMSNELRTLDRVTGLTTYVGTLPSETGAFGFPGNVSPPEAPAAPSNLVVTPDPGGALSCDISWTCPNLQVNGDPLTELPEMRVYRNSVLVYTDSAPVIGGPGNYTDFPPASGLYDFCVVGYNSEGEGHTASEEVWVGEDVPNVVEELVLVEQEGNGYLTWTNPTNGLHGGVFNNPILGYHILRYPDNEAFELTGIQTEFLDDSIPTADYYHYDVTAYNLIGDGGTATSNTEWFGELFSGIIILDLDSSQTGAILQTAIQNNYAGQVVVTSDLNAYPLSSDVEALFLLLGVYQNNFTLTETEAALLTPYLDGGGCVYMEGGDTWVYDTQTSLHGYFNITGLVDGGTDLTTVDGGDFLSGMTWSYSGENNLIDHLASIAPAVTVFSNTAIGYDCGVAYDSGTYKTVGTSFQITGLGGTNTLDDAIEGIIDFFDVTVDAENDLIPITVASLNKNYPNPFNPTTKINYSVFGEAVHTELVIYNIKGQKVKQLVNDDLSTGRYSVVWNGKDDKGTAVSSGVYFYKMKSGHYNSIKKMMLMK